MAKGKKTSDTGVAQAPVFNGKKRKNTDVDAEEHGDELNMNGILTMEESDEEEDDESEELEENEKGDEEKDEEQDEESDSEAELNRLLAEEEGDEGDEDD
ncbi:hypothetical protein DND47_30795, partial [Pseudomonas syringae pv. syringae]